MKNYLWAFMFVVCASCNTGNNSTKENVSHQIEENEERVYFPVTTYIMGQVSDINENGLSPIKINSHDGKSDTTFIKLSDFKNEIKDFIEPSIDSSFIVQYFSEKKFLDQTLNEVTIMYEPKNVLPDSLQWLSWNVYINPETKKVDKIYLNKRISKESKKQLIWKSELKSCSIVTIMEDAQTNNATIKNEQLIKWDY